MKFAFIENGLVATVYDEMPELHPDFLVVEAPADVAEGWPFVDGEVRPPQESGPPTKADLLAHAADRRWQKEIAGIEVAGHMVDTSRESQAMIAGADALAQADPEETVDYKTTTGWIELDAETMHAIALAVGRHARSQFRTERQVCEAIEAGDITTRGQIDQVFAS